MNSILCVILFCVVQKGSHKILLQECVSLYHRILGEIGTRAEVKDGYYFLRESTPSNFLLSIGKNPFESGKVDIPSRIRSDQLVGYKGLRTDMGRTIRPMDMRIIASRLTRADFFPGNLSQGGSSKL
jgi:hypothetical protein